MESGIPQENEFAPYYKGYIAQIESTDIVKYLSDNDKMIQEFYGSIPKDKWDVKYDVGKWTVKEVLQHIIDTERIFAYRMLRIGRKDYAPLIGFDQNVYARNVDCEKIAPEKLMKEFRLVRHSTLAFLENLDASNWKNIGIASESSVSCRALAYMIAGHEKHHRQILKKRYL